MRQTDKLKPCIIVPSTPPPTSPPRATASSPTSPPGCATASTATPTPPLPTSTTRRPSPPAGSRTSASLSTPRRWPLCEQQRDRIRDHFTATDQWRHGYWRMHEAHHGTEHFELFLGALHRLDPDDDGDTTSQLVDAAEHIGNWVADVPPWFDWETGLFRSTFLGTDGAKVEPGLTLNVPDHFRLRQHLPAHTRSDGRTALPRPGRRPRRSLGGGDVGGRDAAPGAGCKSGPIYEFAAEAEAAYRSYMGEAPALHDDVDRAENFLASGATGALLTLWQQTGDGRFRSRHRAPAQCPRHPGRRSRCGRSRRCHPQLPPRHCRHALRRCRL